MWTQDKQAILSFDSSSSLDKIKPYKVTKPEVQSDLQHGPVGGHKHWKVSITGELQMLQVTKSFHLIEKDQD